jgi:hypothetical protein
MPSVDAFLTEEDRAAIRAPIERARTIPKIAYHALALCCEPIGSTKSRLTVSSLFPKSTVARNDFEEITKNDYRPNDIVVREDVEISLRQAAAIAPPFARMVTLQKLEKPLNQITNWILDRVIGK